MALSIGQSYLDEAKDDMYDIQHNKILEYVNSWNNKYHDEASHLTILIGNTGQSKTQVLNEVELKKRLNDNMRDNYPYAKDLLAKHEYQPISYVDFKFMNVIRASQSDRVQNGEGVEFNVTTDLKYEVLEHGMVRDQMDDKRIHGIRDIPMIQKLFRELENPKDCKYKFHGRFDKEANKCLYYLQTRKICLVMDQNSTTFKLDDNYKDYRCNYMTHEPGFIMTNYFRWYDNDREPTLSDLNAERFTVEVFMSEEPNVKTLSNLDVFHFALKPTNYRHESIICFAVVVISVFVALFLCSYKDDQFTNIDPSQQLELNALEVQDESYRKLQQARREFQQKKKNNRKNEIHQIQTRDMMRKMILQPQATFNTNNSTPIDTHGLDNLGDLNIDTSSITDSSNIYGGNNVTNQNFLSNNSMYSLGTGADDLDLSAGYIEQGIDDDNESPGMPSEGMQRAAYALAKDTSWSFAQDSQDPSISIEQHSFEKSGEHALAMPQIELKMEHQIPLDQSQPNNAKLESVFDKYRAKIKGKEGGFGFKQLDRTSQLDQSPDPKKKMSETPGKQDEY